MHTATRSLRLLLLLVFGNGVGLFAIPGTAAPLELHTRGRIPDPENTNEFRVVEQRVFWEPKGTAVVICDMWDQHWCPDATARVAEMAPRMNEVVKAARARGMLIVHCPSDTMPYYKDHPGRLLAQSAPKAETRVPLQGWCSLAGAKEPRLPIDDSDEGCDGCPDCKPHKAWSRQHPALGIEPGDAITDSVEAFYLMRQRGITNVIVMGVHANMCVLGRPFSIRQMVAQGQNVVVMRDMTDSMYNHRKAPYVSHFRGTELVVEHIEKYWCPSVTSADLLGGEPFRFKGDVRPRLLFLIGEDEYDTKTTLPDFARRELEPRGLDVTLAQSSEEDKNRFPGLAALKAADLLLVSVRRRALSKADLDLIRAHVAAKKPVVGIRTASHAFDPQPAPSPENAWPGFDDEILGADYQGHYGAGPATVVSFIPETAGNPILNGVSPSFRVPSHLYKYRKLLNTVTPLLEGATEDGKSPREPVAWINTSEARRVFYTSMGAKGDFADPSFRRLLLNGILWALDLPIPPAAAPTPGVAIPPNPQPATPASRGGTATTTTPAMDPLHPLSPAEAAKSFHVAPDLEWDQVLAEPQVAQPVFLNFDERGRMWVVEYRQYPHPAGLTMVSRDNVWRAVYDKVPLPPPRGVRGADRISIHEDTDGDGVYDKHTVFVDGLNIATSVCRGRGGVWVLNPPYLLFYPDANNDDVPDGDPIVHLAGFGLEDTHSVVNSLRWGPDGWLYAAQGSTVTAAITRPGLDAQPIAHTMGQQIWRYHPETRRFEVFSEGGGNAFGCEIDEAGRIFSGHNGGNTRGFHYMQGAYLQKGFEKHGPLSNPYAFGYFPAMAHNDVERFTHNFILYAGGALPEGYQGRLLGVEPLQGRIVMSEITPVGSTFRTRDVGHPVSSDDKWFRPVDIKSGPDGAVYVCDWYDRQVNHYRNHEGQLDASNGRIYRLRARGSRPAPRFNLATASSSELLAQLRNPNIWFRQTALRLLADRHDATTLPTLEKLIDSEPGPVALESLWALHLGGGLTEARAVRWLAHPNPQVRLWTLRLMADAGKLPPALRDALATLAAREPQVEVRAQIACSVRRLPAAEGFPILRRLLEHDEDLQDPRVPLLLWWALEDKAESERGAVVSLLEETPLWNRPLVSGQLLDRLMRRYAQSGGKTNLLTAARLFELAPGEAQARKLMAGFEEAYKGRPLSGLPPELVSAMARHMEGSLSLGLRQGRAEAVKAALRAIVDPSTPEGRRLEYLGILAEVRIPESIDPVLSLLEQSTAKQVALRRAALAALQGHEDPRIATQVALLHPKLDRDTQAAAQNLLASRIPWTLALLRAVEAGTIPKGQVNPAVLRQVRQLKDPAVRSLADKLWGPAGTPTTAEMEKKILTLASVVRGGVGDPYNGRDLFKATCAGCHTLFGDGGKVGPDLTTYKRDDLEGMLLNIVNPSAEIREGFENYSIETRDERSLSGFLVEQDTNRVVLRGVDGQTVSLERSAIAEMRPGGTSLMPEGLLDPLGDQQVRDLFAYLRSTQPLVGERPGR